MARIVGIVVVLAGLLLRVWAIGRAPLGSDVAVVALMARGILHGHFSAFYWGQTYGGAEPYVVAAVFALAGQSSATVAATPVILDVVACLLVWRVGRHLFTPATGILAALLFWIWPPVYVLQSTMEYGFRWLALCCGLGAILFALRIVERTGKPARQGLRNWVGLGALAGLGFWCTPEIGYFLVPILLLLVVALTRARRPPALTEVAAALVAGAVGALPWIWANVRSGFASLHAPRQLEPAYGDHLSIFFVRVLPMVLGLRRPVSGDWLLAPAAGEALYGLLIALLLCWSAVLVRRRRGLVIVAFLAVFPFLYALSPFTWYWADGRYALCLAPVLALLVGSAAVREATADGARRGARRPRLAGLVIPAAVPAAALVALGATLTLAADARLAPYPPVRLASAPRATWFSWSRNPNNYLVDLATGLEADRVRFVYSGYWTAYPLDFESGGGLVATPLGAAYSRNSTMLAAVERSPDPAWLFARPSRLRALEQLSGSSLLDPGCAARGDRCLTPGDLQDYLRHHHLRYRLLDLGDYQAVVPEGSLRPNQVLGAFGIAR